MIDGKAILMREDDCDAFGDCLPACPAEAISLVEREAAHMTNRRCRETSAARRRKG